MLRLVPRLSLISVETLEKLVGDVMHSDILDRTTAELIITRNIQTTLVMCSCVTACLMIQIVEDQHLT